LYITALFEQASFSTFYVSFDVRKSTRGVAIAAALVPGSQSTSEKYFMFFPKRDH
jgi:hypothetical protein